MSKSKKIEMLIVVLVCIICEAIGLYIGFSYRKDFLGGTSGYFARVVESYDGHAIVECYSDSKCDSLGKKLIEIEVPDNTKFNLDDKIRFRKKLMSNKYYYYKKDDKKIDKLEDIAGTLIGFPIVSLFFYFSYCFIYKKEIKKIHRYIPLISAISFALGMTISSITEIDAIQGIGMLLMIFPFVVPFMSMKRVKNDNIKNS